MKKFIPLIILIISACHTQATDSKNRLESNEGHTYLSGNIDLLKEDITKHCAEKDAEQICEINSNRYFVYGSGTAPDVKIGLNQKENTFFNNEEFQDSFPAKNSHFFPEPMEELLDQKSLLYTWSGDTAEIRWQFYALDPENMNSELIEDCMVQQSKLDCEIEYKP